MLPRLKIAGASFVTISPEQLSDTVGEPKLTLEAPHWPASVLTVISTGHVINGSILSRVTVVIVRSPIHPAIPKFISELGIP